MLSRGSSSQPTTQVYELSVAVSMMVDHARRRHSSFSISPSDSPWGHMMVPDQEGAISRTSGQSRPIASSEQLQVAGGGETDGGKTRLSGTIGSLKDGPKAFVETRKPSPARDGVEYRELFRSASRLVRLNRRIRESRRTSDDLLVATLLNV